jgi:hypothetical protein
VTRAELLPAVAAAASAFALGQDYPAGAAVLNDRRFSLRLPFGCGGADPKAPIGYAFDEARQTLKLTARPETWTQDAAIRTLLAGEDTEAIEGFWIGRPWILTADCPQAANAAGADAAGADPSPQTVGLARIFDKGASRLLRRSDRPYEVSRRVQGPPGPGGFRLVLEGRITPNAEGRAILCRSDGPQVRPVCLVRVEFDRAAFETPAGEMLAEWRS